MGYTAVMSSNKAQHSALARQTTATIDAVRAYRGLSRPQLAEASGINYHRLTDRMTVRTAWDTDDIEAISEALDVPAPVLLRDRDDALRWLLSDDNDGPTGGGAQGRRQSGWTAPTDLATARIARAHHAARTDDHLPVAA